MIQLFKYLIFGKQCQHKWKCDKSMTPYRNAERHIYICEKCGKIKTVKLHISVYSD